jgi:SAM-dependent methyltransferase
MLARAHVNAPLASLAHGRAEQLPWPAASCQRMFCINAFHHFIDKTAFLREAHRVLQPGGAIMTVGLDPHVDGDCWYIYDCFKGTREIDRERYPATEKIRQWLSKIGFTDCRTVEVQRFSVEMPAREALEQGRLDKSVTSQLAVLTDEEYRRGIDLIREEIAAAEVGGTTFCLTTDIRLYATFGRVKAKREQG